MQNWIFIITIFVSVNKREFTIFIIWIWFVHFSFRPVSLFLISMRPHIETVIGHAYVQSVGRFPRTETIHRPLSVIWSYFNISHLFFCGQILKRGTFRSKVQIPGKSFESVHPIDPSLMVFTFWSNCILQHYINWIESRLHIICLGNHSLLCSILTCRTWCVQDCWSSGHEIIKIILF